LLGVVLHPGRAPVGHVRRVPAAVLTGRHQVDPARRALTWFVGLHLRVHPARVAGTPSLVRRVRPLPVLVRRHADLLPAAWPSPSHDGGSRWFLRYQPTGAALSAATIVGSVSRRDGFGSQPSSGRARGPASAEVSAA